MLTLSFDTSTPRLALALSDGADILAARAFERHATHMGQLLPAAQDLLAGAGRKLSEVRLFAASVGPGSFTGIRIGVATAQAFAQALDGRCLALNTLEACAYEARRSSPDAVVVPMLEARNRRVYAAAFRGAETLLPPQVEAADTFFRELGRSLRPGEPLLLGGDEAAAFYAEDETIRELTGRLPKALPALYYPPEVLGLLAAEAADRALFLRPEELLPEYYAPTQAERNFGVYL